MYMPPDETVQDLGEINLSYAGRESARTRSGEVVRTQVVRNPAYDNQYQ